MEELEAGAAEIDILKGHSSPVWGIDGVGGRGSATRVNTGRPFWKLMQDSR